MNTPLKIIRGGRGPGRAAGSKTLALCPSQQVAMDKLDSLIGFSNTIGISSESGMGRSTVMRAVAEKYGGDLVTVADLFSSIRDAGAAGADHWDLAVVDHLKQRLAATSLLLIDDVQLFASGERSMRGPWSKQALMDVVLRLADEQGKTVILSGGVAIGVNTVHSIFYRQDTPVVELTPFGIGDYRFLAAHFMGEGVANGIDFRKVQRLAPLMNAHELRIACSIANLQGSIDTASFISIVAEFITSANTKTAEVEDIRFETMPGMELVAEALETYVVLPLTDVDLADELDLKAKRGVLLYGPPGTGKTSVGRALAHRLKGRFFLVDGSVKTEPAWTFHARISAIIDEAIANAPSVLFIDDADVLFEVGHAVGFGRYLLTLLDGLSGESAAKVCVMMTAMDASKLPEAVLRSGRVELWLETKIPPVEVRADIIRRWLGDKLPETNVVDFDSLAVSTNGFTPADLRRIAGDARAYYAADIDAGRPIADATTYLRRAIDSVIATREAMAVNLADPSLRVN